MHTGVGFYGKYAADGGSSNVHLSGFAIEGDVRERIDTDQVNGIGGALSDSTIDGLYIHHTKVGIWFDGPMTNLKITNNVIVDQIADGINFHTGVTELDRVEQLHPQHRRRRRWRCGRRRPRTPATRSTTTPCRRRCSPTASRSTAAPTTPSPTTSSPTRSARAAASTSGPASAPSRSPGTLWITDNTTVRAGTYELNWNIGLGAIWIYALEKNIDADIQVVGDNFLDNTYNAIMLVADWPVKDLYSITERPLQGHPGRRHRHLGAQRPRRPARRRSRTSTPATSARSASTTAARSTSPPAGSEFSVDRPRRQRRRRHHRPVAGPVGAAEHHHLRRPPAGRRAAGAVRLVTLHRLA